MKRVLIVVYHFPPINNINARRFGEMASYMSSFGWEPIILTTKSEGSLPVNIPEENIIRLGENYQNRKKSIVSEEGFKGIPALFKIPYFFYRKLGIEITSIDRFIFSWGKEIKRSKEIIKKKNPDLIIGSCYPPVSIWMARYLSKVTKKPWIADLQDPISLWNNSKFPFAKFLDEQIEKVLLKSASAIVNISSYQSLKMEKIHRRCIEVIYNGFDKAEEPRRGDKTERKEKKIYYAGRFHAHRMPAVKLLIDWLAKSKKDNIVFTLRSLGPVETNEEILRYAKEKGVSHKISLLPPASTEIVFQEEKETDALILFEDLNKAMRNSEGTIPGKLMEYLPFKAPIVAINRSDSEIGEILKETSRGYLVSDIEQLDKAMEDILNGKGPEFDWEKVERYSRHSLCKRFCNLLDKVYKSPR